MPAQKVRSKDNYQQNLRDNKRKWNFSYKDFSQKLKAFKDSINGRGNAKSGLPPTNIKEPLPAEVGSFLSQLAGDFQTIVSGAERIIAEQAQYARNRRRKKPKEPALTPTPIPDQPGEANKVVETLSRIGEKKYNLEKEASNKITRFFQYISSIFSGKDFNKQRVGLLRQSADLYYSLLDLENDVLSLSISKIPNTISKYKQFKYNFDSFIGTFKGVEEMVERKAKQNGVSKPDMYSNVPDGYTPAPNPINTNIENKQEIINDQRYVSHPDLDKIKNTVHLLFNANLAKKYVVGLFDLFTKYDEEEDPDTKSMFADQIKEVYKNLPRFIAEEVQKKYGPSSKINNMNDIINIIKNNKTAESISDYMIKTSHNFISRYLKKKLVKSIPFNKTAPVRLEISGVIDDIKKIIKKIMDNLEKQLSVQEVNILIEKLQEDVGVMKRPLHVLNVFYMKQFFSNKEKNQKKQKGKSPLNEQELMDYVLQRKLKRELSEDLF